MIIIYRNYILQAPGLGGVALAGAMIQAILIIGLIWMMN